MEKFAQLWSDQRECEWESDREREGDIVRERDHKLSSSFIAVVIISGIARL